MGFDLETKDGHLVFWAEKRSVSVERSVSFNFDEEMVISVSLIEGETDSTEEPKAGTPRIAEEPEPEATEGREK